MLCITIIACTLAQPKSAYHRENTRRVVHVNPTSLIPQESISGASRHLHLSGLITNCSQASFRHVHYQSPGA
jgi:hypothetical protein